MEGEDALTTLVSAPRLFVGGRVAGPGVVTLEGDRIRSVSLSGEPVRGGPPTEQIVLPDGVLTPGLLDLQINGAYGVDFADARPHDWRGIRSAPLPTAGAAFAPPPLTAPPAPPPGAPPGGGGGAPRAGDRAPPPPRPPPG